MAPLRAFIDVPAETILKAAEEIRKTEGKCPFPPMARLGMYRGTGEFHFDTLVCDDRKMGGNNTGAGAQYCDNCTKENEADGS